MKLLLIALIGAAIIGYATYSTMMYMPKQQAVAYPPELIEAYKAWSMKFNKKESDPDLAAYRISIYATNFDKI
jgi:hypothetical protein